MLRIFKYLKGTKKEGLILNTNNNINVRCYKDDGYPGMYCAKDPQDPICVKLRTWYVITFSGCPILWFSKLHTYIDMSTIH